MKSSYRKSMSQAIAEAQMVSDISGISIAALKREAAKFKIKVARVTPGGPMGAEYEVTFSGAEKDLIAYAKEHLGFDDKPGNFMQLKKHLNMSYNDIEEISDKLKLKVLARNIKKLKNKFLKKTIPGTGAMFAQKEEVEIEEGKMKTIATMFDQGKSAEEIAKALKLPVGTVKSILGEEVQIDEKIADSIIKDLQKAYGDLKGKTISPEMANKISKHLDGQSFDVVTLRQLTKAKIPFISTLARNKIYKKTGKFEELEEVMIKKVDGKKGFDYKGQFITDPSMDPSARFDVDPKKYYKLTDKQLKDLKEADINVDNVKKDGSEKEKELKIKLDKEKDQDALEKQLIAAQGQINILKQKLENEKNKTLKPEPNPDTGEVPLTVGVAYKHFKDKAKKEKEDVQEADLTKSQIKKVHDKADDLPKDSFRDRYGKKQGDAVRYATATKMIKKKLGIKEEVEIVYTDKKTRKVVSKKFKNDSEARKFIRQFDGAAGQINFKPSSLLKREDRRLYVETIAGLKKKAEKSGMPYSILKKVYDRGMAAWKGGHRPGASQQQWAFARVNSFVTKSSGTWGGADKDLAAKVRGSK